MNTDTPPRQIVIEQKGLGDALISRFMLCGASGVQPDLILCNAYTRIVFEDLPQHRVVPLPLRRDALSLESLANVARLSSALRHDHCHVYSLTWYEDLLLGKLMGLQLASRHRQGAGLGRSGVQRNVYAPSLATAAAPRAAPSIQPRANSCLVLSDAAIPARCISEPFLQRLRQHYARVDVRNFKAWSSDFPGDSFMARLTRMGATLSRELSGVDIYCTDSFPAHFLYLMTTLDNVFVVFNLPKEQVWCPPRFQAVRGI